jgi:SAM-dependent methyltransferase
VTAAQEAFLRTYHAEHPAVTSKLFAGDQSSYETLRDRVAGCRRVLDLGCGDGVLLELLAPEHEIAGVDISRESLALAPQRPALAGATLLQGRAQSLPFADNSFDACVSHMAMMLMGDIEQVAAEIARVLSPGGVLSCAVGSLSAGDDAFDLFRSLVRPAIQAAPASQRDPHTSRIRAGRLGDRPDRPQRHSGRGVGVCVQRLRPGPARSRSRRLSAAGVLR